MPIQGRRLFMLRTCHFLVIALLLLTECGGGGGSDECNDSVACIGPNPETDIDATAILGSYDINYSLASNSCVGASPLRNLHETYVATSGFGYHAIPTVDVASNTGLSYQNYSSANNTDGQTFLTVYEIGSQNLVNFLSGMDCVEEIGLSFTNINTSKVLLQRTSYIDCANPGETIVQGSSPHCEVVYNGQGKFTPQ